MQMTMLDLVIATGGGNTSNTMEVKVTLTT